LTNDLYDCFTDAGLNIIMFRVLWATSIFLACNMEIKSAEFFCVPPTNYTLEVPIIIYVVAAETLQCGLPVDQRCNTANL
jgi:hypothetical protein